MPGTSLRPRHPTSATGLFGPLTRLELLVLATKLREGKISARQSALRCRSLHKAWNMIKLSNSLADLEDEANQALAHLYPSSARALVIASSASRSADRSGICLRRKTDSPSSTAQKRSGKSSTGP